MTEKINEPEGSTASEIVLDSTTLFKDQKLVLIRHNGECYRLAITKTGKLILTK